MSNKETLVATVKTTKSPDGKLQTEPSTAHVSVPSAGFYVNSDAGLNKNINESGAEKAVDSKGKALVTAPETTYNERNPLFGIKDGETQYIYEWLDNLWCDFKACPIGIMEGQLRNDVQERIKAVDTTSPVSGETINKLADEASLYNPFSESVGSLLAVETIKDSTNTPVSENSDSKHLDNVDIALPSTLAYDQIGSLGGQDGTTDINKDITSIMRRKIDNVFKMNMVLIKDPKIWDKATNTFRTMSLYRSDGTGYIDLPAGNPDLAALQSPVDPSNPVMAVGSKQSGVAHGTNLITDTRHYDRMNDCAVGLERVLLESLKPTMFSVWRYRKGRKVISYYTSPLTITFPVERIETPLDGYTFDPIVSYLKSTDIDTGDQETKTSTNVVATKYITNKQILGSEPVSQN